MKQSAKPECFGEFEKVFPPGADGLREISPNCRRTCGKVNECLKEAVSTPEGMKMRAERYEASPKTSDGGILGFLERWSELKSMKTGRKKGLLSILKK